MVLSETHLRRVCLRQTRGGLSPDNGPTQPRRWRPRARGCPRM